MTATTHNSETLYASLDSLARFSIHTKPRNSQSIDRLPILVSPCIVFTCIYSFCLSFCILCIITATPCPTCIYPHDVSHCMLRACQYIVSSANFSKFKFFETSTS